MLNLSSVLVGTLLFLAEIFLKCIGDQSLNHHQVFIPACFLHEAQSSVTQSNLLYQLHISGKHVSAEAATKSLRLLNRRRH